MHDYVVTMMLYVLYLTYAIAALVTIYASLQIFIKMNAGQCEPGGTEEDFLQYEGLRYRD